MFVLSYFLVDTIRSEMFDEGFPENVRYSVYGTDADDTMLYLVLSIVLFMTSAPWT